MKNVLRSWYNHFKENDILWILEDLLPKVDILYENTKVFPRKDEVFRAFKECDYDNLKVIILGQDPYPGVYNNQPSACGLCFATENGYINPSLKNIIKEFPVEVGRPSSDEHLSESLVSWPSKGVLMLNTALTVEKGQPNSHKKVWERFTKEFLKTIQHKDVVWLLMGKQAENAVKDLGIKYKVITGHPSPLNTTRPFKGSQPFTKVNQLLKKLNKQEIKWKVYGRYYERRN